MRILVMLAIVAAPLWIPSSLYAAADPCAESENAERLQLRYENETCRKALGELQQIETDVFKGFGPYEGQSSFEAWPDKAAEQLRRVQLAIRDDLRAAQAGGQARYAARLGQLDERVSVAIKGSADLTTLNDLSSAAAPRELLPSFWRVSGDPADTRGELAVKHLEEENCLDARAGDARCERVFADATRIADHTYAAAQVVGRLHYPLRREFRAQAEQRTGRWSAYLYDAQFQYWWELVFNRYLEEQCPSGLNSFVARLISKKCEAPKVDRFGNELGFRDAPDYRATLLHPDVGVMYLDDEPKGERFKPAIVVQAIGYEWWQWRDSKIEDRRGAALVVTAADNARVDELGYGVQLRWNSYALAVTDHDGKLAVTLNLDLTKYLGTVSPKYAEELKLPLELD